MLEQTLLQKHSRSSAKKLNIQVYSIMLSPKSDGQVEAYIKFVKGTIKECMGTNQDINPPVGAGLPSPSTMLFNRPIWGL